MEKTPYIDRVVYNRNIIYETKARAGPRGILFIAINIEDIVLSVVFSVGFHLRNNSSHNVPIYRSITLWIPSSRLEGYFHEQN